MSDYHDYNENLVFEPKMTWEELCEYAESKGAFVSSNRFYFNYLWFDDDGDIVIEEPDKIFFVGRERSYEQMKAIIEALRG